MGQSVSRPKEKEQVAPSELQVIPKIFFQIFECAAVHLSALDLVSCSLASKDFNMAVTKLPSHVFSKCFFQEVFGGRWIGATLLFQLGPSYEPFGIEYLDEPCAKPPQFRLIAMGPHEKEQAVRWEDLSWRERIRQYNRPSLLKNLSRGGKLKLTVSFSGCFHSSKLHFEIQRNSDGSLMVENERWKKDEEEILSKCLYRFRFVLLFLFLKKIFSLENHLATPFGSTSRVRYVFADEGGKVLLEASHSDGSCILDSWLRTPKIVKSDLLQLFSEYERECLTGFKAKVEQQGCWYK